MCFFNFYTTQILTSTFRIIECISRLIKVTDCNNVRWKLDINVSTFYNSSKDGSTGELKFLAHSVSSPLANQLKASPCVAWLFCCFAYKHSLNIPSPLTANSAQVNTKLLETLSTSTLMRWLGQLRTGVSAFLLLIRKDRISYLYTRPLKLPIFFAVLLVPSEKKGQTIPSY